jgi:hypothetical protein
MGAPAASFYRMHRTTADIDIITAINREKAKSILFPSLRTIGLEVEEKTIDDAFTVIVKFIQVQN